MESKKIKHIIFDFGGVLLNLDYKKTFEALSSLMDLELSFDALPPEFHEIYLKYERGEIKSETFMWNIQKLANKQITQPHLIIRAWNAMLLGWNPKRLPWLLQLKEDYHTYILSNTNAMHIDWVRKDLKKNHNITDFESTYFDCVHYSHDMGMQKPDTRIFEEIIAANNIKPSEALYIDDNKENIAAAARTGLHAVWHDPTLEIIDELPKYLKNIT